MTAYYDGENTFFIGEFDSVLEQNLLLPLTVAIHQQTQVEDGYVDLWITSYGGNEHLMMHVIELMELAKREGVTVRTMVTGAAYSAGSMVAVAGSPGERYIGRSAMHLAHYGTTGKVLQSTPLQTTRVAGLNQASFKNVVKHYKKYCDIPDLEEHLKDDNWFIPATKAIRWGMADRYLEKLPLA